MTPSLDQLLSPFRKATPPNFTGLYQLIIVDGKVVNEMPVRGTNWTTYQLYPRGSGTWALYYQTPTQDEYLHYHGRIPTREFFLQLLKNIDFPPPIE